MLWSCSFACWLECHFDAWLLYSHIYSMQCKLKFCSIKAFLISTINYSTDVKLGLALLIICTQWCTNSHSYRLFYDKSNECLLNWNYGWMIVLLSLSQYFNIILSKYTCIRSRKQDKSSEKRPKFLAISTSLYTQYTTIPVSVSVLYTLRTHFCHNLHEMLLIAYYC